MGYRLCSGRTTSGRVLVSLLNTSLDVSECVRVAWPYSRYLLYELLHFCGAFDCSPDKSFSFGSLSYAPMRQQRPRGTTTRESVISAALDVIDDVGFDNLTIRAVAAAVSAPPMSLYTHFANKEELLDLMYVELARRLYPDSGEQTWQGELAALARHVRSTLLAHPHWTPLLSRRVSVTSAVAVRERILTLMVESGIRADAALAGVSAVVLGTIGFVLAEHRFREGDGSSAFDRRFERLKTHFEEQPEGEEPTTRLAFAGTPSFAMQKSFEMMLETLIMGLEQHAPNPLKDSR